MDFLIKFTPQSISDFKIEFCENLETITPAINTLYVEKLKHLDYVETKNQVESQIAFGDVIGFNGGNCNLPDCKGIFYLVTLNDEKKRLTLQPDMHGLLPIFYCQLGEFFFASSSFIALASRLDQKTINPDFYPQLALLFTQINGETYFNKIKRLEYGEIVELSDTFKIHSVNRFFNFFTTTPKSFKSSIHEIADKFIEISKDYLQEPCAISLTGGFDGRTITACAHYHNKNFMNFSYGRKGNGDVDNPLFIANKLGLKFY